MIYRGSGREILLDVTYLAVIWRNSEWSAAGCGGGGSGGSGLSTSPISRAEPTRRIRDIPTPLLSAQNQHYATQNRTTNGDPALLKSMGDAAKNFLATGVFGGFEGWLGGGGVGREVSFGRVRGVFRFCFVSAWRLLLR